MIYIDVDAAVILPLNSFPLLDDTDFKTIETGLVYNSAGLVINWNFVTSAGVMTMNAITATTAGVFDITEPVADKGMYAIEMPASGQTAGSNNDREGYGWFTGVATGILPWSSPMFCFRAAALNDALVDGGDLLDVNAAQILGTAISNPATAGVLDVNLKNIANAAVSTTTAQLGVNAVQLGGTALTGRDIGASVLLSAGTGTGQLDFTSGVVKSNLVQILATALTETAGYLAAGFKKFFNIASPVHTVGSIDQTGDAYARLGAPAGASVSADVAAVKSDSGTLITRLTATRAGYLDQLEHIHDDTNGTYSLAIGAGGFAAIKADTAAIKVKTDYLPSATAGAAGGVFIAGANAATSITTALTANITGNVSGSVGSVTGAVGSVTGNVGGNVAGSVASVTGAVGSVAANGIGVTSIATDAITALTVKADAVTKIQNGLATPTNITAGTIATVTNLTNLPAAAATAAELAKVPKSDSTVTWNATALASINAEVDAALNTAIPGSPTADSINERIAALDSAGLLTLTGLLDAADAIESNVTVRLAFRAILAALAGQVTGGGTTSIALKNAAGTKTRAALTVDSSGNRSAVTYDNT